MLREKPMAGTMEVTLNIPYRDHLSGGLRSECESFARLQHCADLARGIFNVVSFVLREVEYQRASASPLDSKFINLVRGAAQIADIGSGLADFCLTEAKEHELLSDEKAGIRREALNLRKRRVKNPTRLQNSTPYAQSNGNFHG